ncbi:MAG: hypothetical protein LBE31_09495 [Deltaproteobacteria bacterium]|jgi:tetratricopeptide (TPR) repeat protein|nr:hypothetical protein [Deltaproteobacteria bacterium]
MKLKVIFLFLLVSVLANSGCSLLPKITIIDDPLSKEEHFNFGLAYENEGDLVLAEKEYRLALPKAEAYLALGNLAYQRDGDPKEAESNYRRALSREKLPAAANNLAWLLLVEGGDLNEALELANLAVLEGQKRGLPSKLMDNYKSTLAQIQKAILESSKAFAPK